MRNLFKTFKFTFQLLYRSSGLLILAYLLMNLFCSILPLVDAYILKEILNRLASSQTSFQNLLLLTGGYMAMLVAARAAQSSAGLCNALIRQKAENQYALDVSGALDKLPLSFLDTSRGKNLVDEVKHLKAVAANFPNFVVQAVSESAAFVVSFSAIASFHLWFSLLFLLLTVPGLLCQYHFRKTADQLRRRTAPDVRRFSYYRWMLTDPWPAKDVRMYNLTDSIKGRYDAEKEQYRKANKKIDKKRMAMALVSELIMRSGEILFSAFVAWRAVSGEIGIGDATLYISLAVSATISFENAAGTFLYGIVRTAQNMGYVFAFFGLAMADDGKGKRRLESFESLVFDEVYFKYPSADRYVLNGVSFTLDKGDRLSIVGINGSGKSTIIKLMLGLYEVEQGRIFINGFPMEEYDRKDIRRLFSVLFQTFAQYPLTLCENIALSDIGRMGESGQIEGALRKSGILGDLELKLENGLDSFMTRQFDDRGTELSRGQWQKVALARAYFKDSPIVIFDEPSAALDAEAEDAIFRNFEEISDGKTGIMISHRISSAKLSNKIIVIDGGKITEQGTHHELAMLGGLYAKLYDFQHKKYAAKAAISDTPW